MYSNNVFRKFKNRMRHSGGFTFTELLAATIIMLLSTGLVVQCVDIAKEQYGDRTMDSEAQLLVTALSDAIQDHLQYASDVKLVGDAKVSETPTAVTSFYSDRIGKSGNFYVVQSTNNADDADRTMVANDNGWNGVKGQITFGAADGISQGLVSDTAYKADGSPNGGLVAAMMMTYYLNKPEDEGGVAEFHPTVWIYAKVGHRILAKKSFVVRRAYDTDTTTGSYAESEGGNEENRVTVTFDWDCEDDGNKIISTVNVIKGNTVTKPSENIPKKTGYIFADEWHEIILENGEPKESSDAFNFNTTIDKDITLKAIWTIQQPTYTVTFYPRNANSTKPITVTAEKGATINIPKEIAPPSPPNGSYTFAGWYTNLENAQNTTKTYIKPELSADAKEYTIGESDVKFYARWMEKEVKESGDYNVKNDGQKKNRYNMTFDADTGYIYFYGYQEVNNSVTGTLNNYKDYGNKWYLKNSITKDRFQLSISNKVSTDYFTNSVVNSMKWKYNPTIKTFQSTNSTQKKTYYIVYFYSNDQNLYFVEKSLYDQDKSKYPLPQFNLPTFDFKSIDAGL